MGKTEKIMCKNGGKNDLKRQELVKKKCVKNWCKKRKKFA